MAYSTQRSVSDGTLQLLMIEIEFFDQSEITAYFDNVPTTAYTWATAKSIQFDAVVPNGVEVLIRRTTDLSKVRHIFTDGAQFKAGTLDDDFKQILHIAQEAVEGANVGDIYSTLNMHGNPIKNVGLATDPGDAVSLGQIITESGSAWNAKILAEAARDAAQAAAGTATTQAGIATTQAGNAAASASTATTQAGIATTQAGNSATSATASDTARAAAVVAQTAAAGSATLAQKWAAELEDVAVSGGLYSSYHYSRKAAASATAAASSAADAAASAGVFQRPAFYITGLKLTWVSLTSIRVEVGEAAIPSTGVGLKVPSALLVTPPNITGLGHIYLYNNAGTPAVEMVATEPAAYSGDAYQKTGDATRRYLGSVLLASGAAYNFRHYPAQSRMSYMYGQTTAPFSILSSGTATSAALVSAAGVVPVTATHVDFLLSQGGSGSTYLGNEDQANALTTSTWQQIYTSTGYNQVSMPLGLNTVNRRFQYLVSGSASAFMVCNGYIFNR